MLYEHVEEETLHEASLYALLLHFVSMVLRHDAQRRAMYARDGRVGAILIDQVRTVVYPMGHAEWVDSEVTDPGAVHQEAGTEWSMTTCVKRHNVEGGVT